MTEKSTTSSIITEKQPLTRVEDAKSPLSNKIEDAKSPLSNKIEDAKSPLLDEAEDAKSPLLDDTEDAKSPLLDETEDVKSSLLEEVKDLKSQLEQAQQSVKNNWDKLLRSQAEMENLKRRSIKDLANAHRFAINSFAKALLNVKDSLILGIKSAKEEKSTIKSVIEGLEMIDKVFNTTTKLFGIETINPINEIFNPEFHEVVTMTRAVDKKTNTVLDVVQIGFTLNGRLLRPAMVIIAN